MRIFITLMFITALNTTAAETNSDKTPLPFADMSNDLFYEQQMKAAPYFNEDTQNHRKLNIPALNNQNEGFKSSQTINFAQPDWHLRAFKGNKEIEISTSVGRVLTIEMAQDDKQVFYRYRANNSSFNELFEPWSSSKIMPITAAILTAKQQGLNSNFSVGQYSFADLITSVHSYSEQDVVKDDSNVIATYFANSVGRKTITNMLQQQWLKLPNDKISLRGAYGSNPLTLEQNVWYSGDKQYKPSTYQPSSEDPYYLSYRCETCGLTGNKPMTTLALAEWLKRLVISERDSTTQLSNLNQKDVEVLFFGDPQSTNKKPQGMQAGVSRMLANAIASALGKIAEQQLNDSLQVKATLDSSTNNQWQIFQKIGWGYSGTRSAGEMVYLAHVQLNDGQDDRAFTITAQTQAKGSDSDKLYEAGRKMQLLLMKTMSELLTR
ncbi:MAG: hypothetical protein HWE10_14230 [Gammaproteobacteria bacterium]|nr:hypothetical protein [Gammaproteobacteria bacterium]